MLIFIENTPRAYAWGSTDDLPEMLGFEPTGEPQAELWLGTHPGSPAQVAKATPEKHTLIDLVQTDPDLYGVDGGPLPFLLKVLAIGGPLSLQVHPDAEQAAAGFAAEEASGKALDDPDRNYGDPNHKPELLVALTEVTALSGFRDLDEARRELLAFASELRCHAAGGAPGPLGSDRTVGADATASDADALQAVAERLSGDDPEALRREFLLWAFSGDPVIARALAALAAACTVRENAGDHHPARLASLQRIVAEYPGDPGLFVAMLLHHVVLQPGEALYLPARQLHAYLGGVGVEVMAASDNVLRAGLTPKHVDVEEVCRIVDTAAIDEPRFDPVELAPGLVAWQPPVDDFQLMRAHLCSVDASEQIDNREHCAAGAAPLVMVEAPEPLVLMVTAGRVRVERPDGELAEVATARRGQSLYVSAGEAISLTGDGEVFLATVAARAAGASTGG